MVDDYKPQGTFCYKSTDRECLDPFACELDGCRKKWKPQKPITRDNSNVNTWALEIAN